MDGGSAPTTILLPDGLVGLPALRTFEIRPLDPVGLQELVSLDDPGFGLVAVSADAVRPGYAGALAGRGLVAPGASVLVLLAVHGDPPSVTANLAGPIVVNRDATARQLVLEGDEFPPRQALSEHA